MAAGNNLCFGRTNPGRAINTIILEITKHLLTANQPQRIQWDVSGRKLLSTRITIQRAKTMLDWDRP